MSEIRKFTRVHRTNNLTVSPGKTRPIQILLPGKIHNRWISLSPFKLKALFIAVLIITSTASVSLYRFITTSPLVSASIEYIDSIFSESPNKQMTVRAIFLSEEEKQKIRINELEKELATRLHTLDSILESTVGLDFNAFDKSDQKLNTDSKKLSITESDSKLGIGGGDEDIDTFDILSEEKSDDLLRISSSDSILSKIDLKTEQIKNLPIGAPVIGKISSGFGYRISPFSRRRTAHRGLDFSAYNMTPVVATGNGKITKAGWEGSYGRTVIVDHGNGIKTRYAHLSKINVKVGDEVCRGQKLGLLGSSGRSTGPHLHYEVRLNGKSVDPKPYLEIASFLNLLKPQS